MAAVDDLDQLLEQWHPASDEFLKGNPEPVKKMFSHKEDVTLANPYGPPVRGWDKVEEVIDHAASQAREGRLLSVEIVAKHVSPELAYVVHIEHPEAKLGATEEITPFALRVTMIFRPEEEDEWKIVHRHADPITTPQPAESVIQE
jgi:ketosteroid isomerase-like protein